MREISHDVCGYRDIVRNNAITRRTMRAVSATSRGMTR